MSSPLVRSSRLKKLHFLFQIHSEITLIVGYQMAIGSRPLLMCKAEELSNIC